MNVYAVGGGGGGGGNTVCKCTSVTGMAEARGGRNRREALRRADVVEKKERRWLGFAGIRVCGDVLRREMEANLLVRW